MDRVKKIALVTCVSNYERYNAFVRTVHEELKARGNYVLYVITNYSVFLDGMQFLQGGDSSIYRLLDMLDLDGCIFDSNLASNELTELLATPLRKRGIPTLSINLKAKGTPTAAPGSTWCSASATVWYPRTSGKSMSRSWRKKASQQTSAGS